MKNLLFTILLTISSSCLIAQTSLLENKITIVSCKTGDLYVDGNLIGKIEADDAKQLPLSAGEHYLQVKTASEKYNLSAIIDQNAKGLFRIGCEPAATQTATAEPLKAILLIDKQLNLGGALTGEVQRNVVALDEDDNMLLNCVVANPKGSARVSVRQYPSGNEIFRNESFNALRDQKINIPSKGIYVIEVSTGALFGRDIHLAVTRIPSPKSDPNFKTSVRKYFDTTGVEVVKNTVTVHSANTLTGTNRTIIKIPLPANTTYWVYWIGVGQEAREKLKQVVSLLGQEASKFANNPLIAYGMKHISALPMLSNKSIITYRFTDDQNAGLFLNKQPYSCLNISYADNVSTSYSLVNGAPKEVALAMVNTNSFLAQEVDVQVVAFRVRPMLAMEE